MRDDVTSVTGTFTQWAVAAAVWVDDGSTFSTFCWGSLHDHGNHKTIQDLVLLEFEFPEIYTSCKQHLQSLFIKSGPMNDINDIRLMLNVYYIKADTLCGWDYSAWKAAACHVWYMCRRPMFVSHEKLTVSTVSFIHDPSTTLAICLLL